MKIFLYILMSIGCCIKCNADSSTKDTEIVDNLNILLDAKGMDQYSVYLLMMPKQVDILANTAADIVDINRRSQGGAESYKHRPYPLRNPERSISLSTNPEIYKSKMPEQAIFVTLSKLGTKVPVQTAEKISAGFANGFVTYLFLQEHVKPILSQIDDSIELNLDISLDGRQLLDGAIYNSATAYTLTDESTSQDLIKTIDNLDLNARAEMAGILLGWEAGARLQSIRSFNAPAYEAALKLISARFTPETMGRSVSYTLTVLQAAGSIKAAVEAGVGKLPADSSASISNKALSEVIQTFRDKGVDTKQIEISKPSELASLCFELTLCNLISADNSNAQARRNQLAFAKGYLEGAQAISSEVMNYAMVQGYEAGYKSGYKDGYQAGVDAGRIAGMQAGKADGYNAGVEVVNKLNEQLRKAKKSKAENFFGGMLGGFTSTLFTYSF